MMERASHAAVRPRKRASTATPMEQLYFRPFHRCSVLCVSWYPRMHCISLTQKGKIEKLSCTKRYQRLLMTHIASGCSNLCSSRCHSPTCHASMVP